MITVNILCRASCPHFVRSMGATMLTGLVEDCKQALDKHMHVGLLLLDSSKGLIACRTSYCSVSYMSMAFHAMHVTYCVPI